MVNLQYIEVMSSISAQLRLLRGGKKVGIKRLARDLGISYTYLSHIERGRAKPSEKLIRKLADYFDVSEEDLLLAAGKFPPDVQKILYENPKEVVLLLRESFTPYKRPDNS